MVRASDAKAWAKEELRGICDSLYTPFSGTILRTVLDSLRREAARREIRIATYGPCTPTVAEDGWLAAVGGVRTDRVAIFRARRGTHG